ncbi:hypothetical protein CNY89_12380 [Amaricoccus sp. HAR-UPW-R2A-40]|nr:hypothetical protein CNY89_12380 [Amaricoccus sp. HAR-UPW-R2A-40]
MDAVMDHETLAAFVDGALSPEDSAGVVMHLADHPLDAAHVDALMELNALLGEAYAAPLHEPAPEPIVAAILGTCVHVPKREIGMIALGLLHEALSGPPLPARRVELACYMVERNSVTWGPGAPKAGA